jgi:hypothetical protein
VQLRVAEGEVRCGSCAISFNALLSLSDDLPELTDAVIDNEPDSQIAVLDTQHRPQDDEQPPENADRTLEFDAPEKSWSRFFVSREPENIVAADAYQPVPNNDEDADHVDPAGQDTVGEISPLEMETNDHDEWNDFLSDLSADGPDEIQHEYDSRPDEETDDSDEDQADDNTVDQPSIVPEFDTADEEEAIDGQEATDIETDDLEELHGPLLVAANRWPDDNPGNDVIDEPEFTSEAPYELPMENRSGEYLDLRPDEFPGWSGSEPEDTDYSNAVGEKFPWRALTTIAILGVALLGQFLHYNRDNFATHPRYGEIYRNIYAGIGSPLYPDWNLDAFEVRGTEAVAGRSTTAALDILATIEVVGREPVGLPLIRISLHDRWSNPVASRVFYPTEYLGTDSEIPDTLSGGTIFPIKVSVIDPGAEAQNYVVDICLPNRSKGLLCQLGQDPFQS